MIKTVTGVGKTDRKEALRYLGLAGADAQDGNGLLDECEKLLSPVLRPVACYSVFAVTRDGNGLDLGFAKTSSRALEKNLCGCKRIALFAATVGAGVDRLILKYQKLSPARAAALQALGASAAECWCDEVNAQIAAEYGETKPRFSCGYGDLPLSLQKDIFAALQVEKNLGITLSENFFMTPVKSVTAIVGIK